MTVDQAIRDLIHNEPVQTHTHAEDDDLAQRVSALEEARADLEQRIAALEQGQSDPTPDPDSTPVPAPDPDPAPDPEPQPTGDLVGYGSGVTGGSDEVSVDSLEGLRSAIAPGARIIVTTDAVWDLQGRDLTIDVPDVSVIAPGGLTLSGGAYRIEQGARNIYSEGIRSRSGDEHGSADSLDAITINAQDGEIHGLYFRHCEAWWGPDVTWAVLGPIFDVTLDGCIIAEGLLRSKHSESREDIYGHSMGLNLTGLSKQEHGPQRVTIWRSLIAHHQTRNPQLRKAGPVDLIDSIIYGHDRAPYGNAEGGLNIVGCIYRRGEDGEPFATLGDRAKAERMPFRPVDKDGYLTPESVYVHDTIAQGFDFEPVPDRVRASKPMAPLSVASEGPDLERILAYVGAIGDEVTDRLIDDVIAGTGRYVNGEGEPAPNPTW